MTHMSFSEEESKSKRMAAQQMRQNLVNAIINNDEQKRAQGNLLRKSVLTYV